MIKDKVIIITGASAGIGEASARLLASQGAKVVLGARREERLKAIADEISEAGGQAAYMTLDVTSASENQSITQLALDRFGRVDAIFLNAGIMATAPVSGLQTDAWNETVDVNIKGVLNGVAAVMPLFVAQKSGHILATSSVAGLKAYPGASIYGGTKWFVRSFMEVLRMESAMEGTNIRTTTLYPAAISTELLNGISDKRAAEAMQKLYDQHAISPDRIAHAVSFAIEAPSDTTFSELTVGPSTQAW